MIFIFFIIDDDEYGVFESFAPIHSDLLTEFFMKRVKMSRTCDEKKTSHITENINSAFMKLDNIFYHFGICSSFPVNGRLYAFKPKYLYVRKFKNSRHVVKPLFSLL